MMAIYFHKTWQHIVDKMSSLAIDASPLLEACTIIPDVSIHMDEVYHELFKEADVEMNALTKDFLRLICHEFAILMKRQLKSQMPDGEHYMPSQAIMEETKSAPKHNILTERDFAQLDRRVEQKPGISTVSISGRVSFLNNKTSTWLEGLSGEDRSNVMERAREEAPDFSKHCSQQKKRVDETQTASNGM